MAARMDASPVIATQTEETTVRQLFAVEVRNSPSLDKKGKQVKSIQKQIGQGPLKPAESLHSLLESELENRIRFDTRKSTIKRQHSGYKKN